MENSGGCIILAFVEPLPEACFVSRGTFFSIFFLLKNYFDENVVETIYSFCGLFLKRPLLEMCLII